jgi:hypothetical protein
MKIWRKTMQKLWTLTDKCTKVGWN